MPTTTAKQAAAAVRESVGNESAAVRVCQCGAGGCGGKGGRGGCGCGGGGGCGCGAKLPDTHTARDAHRAG
jgi:hypothetical protein